MIFNLLRILKNVSIIHTHQTRMEMSWRRCF